MADKHIVVPYQMFDGEQNIIIYENGECIKTDYVATGSLREALYAMCKEDTNIKRIDIVGNKNYLDKIRKDMKTKFDISNVEVKIIER